MRHRFPGFWSTNIPAEHADDSTFGHHVIGLLKQSPAALLTIPIHGRPFVIWHADGELICHYRTNLSQPPSTIGQLATQFDQRSPFDWYASSNNGSHQINVAYTLNFRLTSGSDLERHLHQMNDEVTRFISELPGRNSRDH